MSSLATIAVIGAGASAGAGFLKKQPPKAEQWQGLNLQEQQGLAIGGNIAAFKPASKLAGMVNTFNAEEIRRMNELSMPGYSAMQAKGTANIMDWMSGKVPTDVSNAVRTNAAQRSVAGGFGGTGMGRNLEARDLGLTSLNVMSKGMDSATRWMQMNRNESFNVSSMFVTPQQTASFNYQQEQDRRNYQNNANQFNFANDKDTQAMAALSGYVGQIGSGMVNYLGSKLTKQDGANGSDGSGYNPSGRDGSIGARSGMG